MHQVNASREEGDMKQKSGFREQISMEFRQQFRRPLVWFCLFSFLALAIGDTLQSGWSSLGNIWINGADMIVRRAIIYSVLGTLAAAGIVGEAMCRDRASQCDALVLMTGASRTTLGLARFLVTFAVVLATASMFIPGVILATLAPGISENQLGPFVASHYLKAFVFYILPTFFVTSSLVFCVATRRQNQTAAYASAVALLAIWVLARMLLGQDVLRYDVFPKYAVLDPFASIASSEYTQGWTALQKNTTFPPITGLMLTNRILWITVGILLVIAGVRSIPMGTSCDSSGGIASRYLASGRSWLINSLLMLGGSQVGGKLRELFRLFSDRSVLLRMIVWELLSIGRMPGTKLVLFFAALSIWWSAASAVTHQFSLPSTDLLLHNTGFYFDKVLVLAIVWIAGELMWCEQSSGVSELLDVQPSSDFYRYLSKTIVLMLVVIAFWLIAIGVNLTYQFTHDYFDFEIGLYLIDSFLFKAPYYFWLCALSIAAQSVIRRRYVAVGVVLLICVSEPLLDALRWYHPIYRFGRVSFFWYSLMDGYGHFWKPHLWLMLYWSLLSTLIWVFGFCCYGRGSQLATRRQLFWKAIRTGWIGWVTTLLIGLVLWVGNHVWIQTTVRATWPPVSSDAQMAAVERELAAKWRNVAQPRIVAIQGELDLYPSQRRLRFEGELTLENQSQVEIDQLLILAQPGLEVEGIEFEPGGREIESNQAINATEFQLLKPLQPGERMKMSFVTSSSPPDGFAVHAKNDNIPEVTATEVIGNGTSLLNLQLMPAMGYSDRVEQKPSWKRRKYGLSEDWTPNSAERGKLQPHDTTHLGWVERIDMTIRTDAGQTAWHAGELVKQWSLPDGRQAFRYVIDRLNRGWSEILSGRYAQKKVTRPGMPPVVMVYDPKHDYVVAEFAAAIHDAMAHFTDRYGPAFFERFPVVEQSLHFDGMGARNGLAFSSEILGWKSNLSVSNGEDLIEMAAHMMGMSWFSDQLIPANSPGAKMIHAGLPYWSAALYLHQRRDLDLDRRLRLQDTLEMFRRRGIIDDEESPFLTELKNSTLLKRKGAILMLYLASLVGAEELEAILAGFLDEWKYRRAPFPTGQDFVDHLRRSIDSKYHPQIADLFEHITTWKLKVVSAECSRIPNGKWQLSATVDAGKIRTASSGRQSEVVLETPVWLVAFSGWSFGDHDVIQRRLIELPSGQSTVRMLLDEKPTRFGIDPYLLLPDRNPRDNVISVKERQ
ncbi:MAG: hypothetical protein GY768_29460 [Planctomycetaceae bacterium]|nr:hypothetical protein [Planctomycetaceae bacterium]